MSSNLQQALQDCLELLESGQADLETCLARHPNLRAELEPLLRSAEKLRALGSIQASPEFKQRGRLALHAYQRANPKPAAPSNRFSFFSNRLRTTAVALVLVLTFLTTGTVLAQSALPGQWLYGWKLGSERLWTAISREPQAATLHFSERRVDELLAIHGALQLEDTLLQGYALTLDQIIMDLETDSDLIQQVYDSLTQQQTKLSGRGIDVPALNDAIRQLPTLTPTDGTDQKDSSPQAPTPEGQAPDAKQETDLGGGLVSTALPNAVSTVEGLIATALPSLIKP